MKRIGKNETTEMAPVKKCFVGLETALYLLFLALDAFSAGGDGVKYLTIVVCLLAAVWSARHGGSRLMAWAMAFTLAADTFLLLLDRNDHNLGRCDSRRQFQTAIITMYHDDSADHTGCHTPGSLVNML